MTSEHFKVSAVGDIFLGEHPVTLGHGVRSVVKRHGAKFLFSEIHEHLADADMLCGNLEGIISERQKQDTGIGSEIFWGESECAEELRRVGFNCLFLANNHTAQHGKDALIRTCQLLDANGIKWTGFNESNPESPRPVLFQKSGMQAAVLAYCDTQQYHLDTPILPLINLENVRRDINAIRRDVEIVIVSLHWGDEFIDYPSPDQVALAHKIIDAGASLILGHHSHTFQGIEQYKRGLIAYSLGSFVKDLWPKRLRESAILKCTLSPVGVEDYCIVPIIINDDWQPVACTGDARDRFENRIAALSKEIGASDAATDNNVLAERYRSDVKRLLRRDRIATALHYLNNMHRYDRKLFLENVMLMAKRRIYKRNV